MASGVGASAQRLAEGRRRYTAGSSRIFDPLSPDGDPMRPIARRGREDVARGTFKSRVLAWSATLQRSSHGEIAVFSEDGAEFASILLGAWQAGKVVFLPGDAQAATCRALQAQGVAFVGSFSAEWNPIRDIVDAPQPEWHAISAETARIVIFTSGSTGAPQAHRKRLSQLLAEVETLETVFGTGLGDCDVLATISHQHIYGLLFKILWPLTAQRPFIAETCPFPEDIVRHLGSRRLAIVSGPALLKRLGAHPDWNATTRDGICAVFSSGAALSLDAAAAVEAMTGLAPIELYGSSETGGIAWRQRVGAVEQSWSALPGVDVRETDGRLTVASPHLPDRSWHVTDDLVTMGSDDRFDLRGRIDQIVKIEGKRVSLTGIESSLRACDLLTEARVVRLPSAPGSRDSLGAVVVPSDAGWELARRGTVNTLRSALRAAVSDAAEQVAIPRRWRWLDRLPVNTAGKTTGRLLESLFEPHALTLPAVHELEVLSDRARLELLVSSHLECFDGHFASIAVLPGVAQVDWAIVFARRYFNDLGAFTRMEAVKFHQVYVPGPLLSLELEWKVSRQVLTFRFSSDSRVHSSGRIHFGH